MEHRKIALAADIIVERNRNKQKEVLLVKRKNNPFGGMWALPGGFVEEEEEAATAAQRELQEETTIDLKRQDLSFLDYFDAPDRDPRGRIVSFVFGIEVDEKIEAKGASDAAEAKWFPISDLPELAFDHRSMIARWEER